MSKILLLFFVVAVLVGFFVLGVWVYLNFFRPEKPKSGIIYPDDLFDVGRLFSLLDDSIYCGQPFICFREFADDDEWREKADSLTVSSEERGFVLGISGSGKTTFLICQLINWIQSGKSFVVSDIKPEIWAILKENGVLERYGYTDIVINPTDKMAHKYNAFDDIDDENFATELVELVEILVGNSSNFSKGAKQLMRAVLLDLKAGGKRVSLLDVRKYLNKFSDTNVMMNDLSESKSPIVRELANQLKRTATNERYIGSCFGELDEAMKFLDNETIATNTKNSDYSLREELQKSKVAVFLQFEQSFQKQTSTLFGFTIAHILRMLQLDYMDRDDVFIAIDEIINSAMIPDLDKKLNTMRSAKMPLFMYLQTLSGLENVYGRGSANLFMSACSLKICYRVNDIDTAKEFSDMVGERECIRWSMNESPERLPNGNVIMKKTRSESREFYKYIEPGELLKLDDGEAVVMYKGESCRMDMPRYYEVYPTPNRPTFSRPSDVFEPTKVSSVELTDDFSNFDFESPSELNPEDYLR